jgi:hypothetical protein
LLTLLVTPVSYTILDDWGKFFRRRLRAEKAVPAGSHVDAAIPP